MSPWLRRVGATAVLVVVVASLIGATVQGVLTALERRRFDRPGRMVDVGGHQLHVFCTGPTPRHVLLEAPLGSLSAHWYAVQAQLAAAQVGTCSYDRSGLGWSERGDASYSTDGTIRELGAVLSQVASMPPTILVGEGFGAAVAAEFARRHPDQVNELVLVDLPAPAPRPSTRSPWLARIGLLRVVDALGGGTNSISREGLDVVQAFGYRPDHLTRSAAELGAWRPLIDSQAGAIPATVRVVRVDSSADWSRVADAIEAGALAVGR